MKQTQSTYSNKDLCLTADQPVYTQFASSASFGTEPLRINSAMFFIEQMSFVSPNWQCQCTEGNTKHLPLSVTWPDPFVILHRAHQGKCTAPSMCALWWQYQCHKTPTGSDIWPYRIVLLSVTLNDQAHHWLLIILLQPPESALCHLRLFFALKVLFYQGVQQQLVVHYAALLTSFTTDCQRHR